MVRGSNPGGGEIFRTCPDRPWGPLSLLYSGYLVFSGVKERPGRDADPSPPSSAVVMKEQSYTSAPPMGRTASTESQCLYKAALYLYLYHVAESFSEKLTGFQLVTKFPRILWNQKVHYHIHTCPAPVPILSGQATRGGLPAWGGWARC